MSDILDAPKPLMELVFWAMDYGVDNVRAGGPLVPFIVTVGETGRTLHRLALPRLEESVEKGRQMIGDLGPEVVRYAFVYDGFFTRPGGERLDAILVEGAERGQPTYIFAQQYRPKRFLRPLRTIGNAAFAGRGSAGESAG